MRRLHTTELMTGDAETEAGIGTRTWSHERMEHSSDSRRPLLRSSPLPNAWESPDLQNAKGSDVRGRKGRDLSKQAREEMGHDSRDRGVPDEMTFRDVV